MGTCILTRQSLPEDRDDSARNSAAQLGKVGAFDSLSTKKPRSPEGEYVFAPSNTLQAAQAKSR